LVSGTTLGISLIIDSLPSVNSLPF